MEDKLYLQQLAKDLGKCLEEDDTGSMLEVRSG
jgi:hypothetical protein